MLEGKELEVKIGDIGSASVDVDDKGIVEISVGVKIDIIAELEKLAKKTDNQIDDKMVEMIKKALGK